MTLQKFVQENREEIDAVISHAGANPVYMEDFLNDDERENWVANDEGLYNWALAEGVEDV